MRIWGRNGHLRPLNQVMKHEEYEWPVEEGWSKVLAEEVLKNKDRCFSKSGLMRHDPRVAHHSFHRCGACFIEVDPADLEELGGLGTIAPCLLERLKNSCTFRPAGSPAPTVRSSCPAGSDPIATMSLQLS